MYSFTKLTLKDLCDDNINDGVNENWDSFIITWMGRENEYAYNGNGTYDNYILIHNRMRDILHKINNKSV